MRGFTEFLDRFVTVRPEGQGNYTVPCPAHPDQRPSLLVSVSTDGKLMLYCRAGCETHNVLSALGMEPRDLFDWEAPEHISAKRMRREELSVGDIAALAQYVDETNRAYRTSAGLDAREYVGRRFGLSPDDAERLRIGVDHGGEYRFPHVTSRYARFPRLTVPLLGFDDVVRGLQGRDLSGKCSARWVSITNPDGAAWSKYGVFRAAQDSETLIITEGPADALTAVGAGYDAVAVRGAALSSSPELAREIAEGARDQALVVIGDRDTAGERFTDQLASTLARHHRDVYALAPPRAGMDLTDWRADNPHDFVRALTHVIAGAEKMGTRENTVDLQEWKELLRFRQEQDGGVPHVDFARFVAAAASGTLRYAVGVGWLHWVDTHWEPDPDDAAARRAMNQASAMLLDQGTDTWCTTAAHILLNDRHRNGVKKELAALPEIRVYVDQLDTHVHLLAFKNGVVDLRDGTLHPHNPDLLQTQAAPVDYRPDAHHGSTRWAQFLTEVHPDPEVQTYVQTVMGYGITGLTREHAFMSFFGATSRNGKGTLTRAMQAAFGRSIVAQVDMEVFERGGKRHESSLATIRNARIVVASEGNEDAKMDVGLLKKLSGGDEIQARALYRDQMTYVPRYLLIMCTNHLLDFGTNEAALWARVRGVEFPVSFKDSPERDLDEKLEREAEAVAAWAVEGAMRYYRDGLISPEAVDRITEMNREHKDPLADMLGDLFIYAEEGIVPRSEFNEALKEWRDKNGHTREYKPSWVKKRLVDAGVEEGRNPRDKRWEYRGIQLAEAVGGPSL